jgi:hypothetical protein
VRAATARLEFVQGKPDPELPACEAEVLGERYGDSAESLDNAYGAYADTTVWLAVLDRSERVLGWGRLLMPGPLPEKTLADAARPPWNLESKHVAASVGLDTDSCWDVATIGIRQGLGRQGAAVSAALYHGLIVSTRVNGADWILAMLNVRVRRLLDAVGLVMHTLPGAWPDVYMGAPGFLPVYADTGRAVAEQRRTHPEAYRRIALGAIDGVEIPPAYAFLVAQPESVDLRGVEARTA